MKSDVTRMSLCVLGSGSAGNCSALVLQHDDQRRPYVILIDAGLSIRQTEQRLKQVGLTLALVREVIVTHFDTDHFKSVWINRAKSLDLKLRFHINHWPLANRNGAVEIEHEPFDTTFEPIPGCRVHTVRFAHDQHGTIGYRFDTAAGRLGLATDLGHVPDSAYELFTDLDLLAIESNYCPRMQEDSGRPTFLKRRIMSGHGHLSNEDSYSAVKRIHKQSDRLSRVILLHLSQQCNSPRSILDLYSKDPELSRKIVMSNQRQPSPWLHVPNGIQSFDQDETTLWSQSDTACRVRCADA